MKTAIGIVVTAAVVGSLAYAESPSKQTTTTGTSRAQQHLTTKLATLVKGIEQAVPGIKTGVVVRDIPTGRELFSRRKDEPFSLASNTKLITLAAALHHLGPAFRFRTRLHGEPPDNNGVLPGDIYLRGGGDPTLSESSLRWLVDELRRRGVRRIAGGITLDVSFFDGQDLPPRFGDQPKEQAYFRPPIGALSFHRNRYTLVVAPNLAGTGLARVSSIPANGYLRITNQVETVGAGRTRLRLEQQSRRGTLAIALKGQINAGSGQRRYRRRVNDTNQFIAASLKALLKRRGIALGRSKVRLARTPADLPVLTSTASAALTKILQSVGKASDNYVAEMVLKTLGAQRFAVQTRRPATWADGVKAVREYLDNAVKLSGNYRYENGSGLFDSSAFSPAQIVSIVAAASSDFKTGSDFLSTLPIAGIDGTLRRRMKKGPATGIVRAKTGTLARVSSLSGVAGVRSHRTIAFSVLNNDFKNSGALRSRVKGFQNAVAEAVADYLRATAPQK